MRRLAFTIAWIALPLLFLAGLAWEMSAWRALKDREGRAQGEISRLAGAIRAQEGEVTREMSANAALLKEMQWSSDRGDPSAFLTRLAELAEGARLKILAIGPLAHQASPQFSKSWHTVQVLAPYRELKVLATRIEQDGGILEEVLLQPQPDGAQEERADRDEIRAQFRMTAMELTGEAKTILQRVVVASGGIPGSPGKPEAPLALALPRKGEEATARIRDPFKFVVTTPPPTAIAAGPKGPPPPAKVEAAKPLIPMEVKGIVTFPGGYLAILNNQIVRVGDVVSEHQVERITDSEVVLRQPDGFPRTVALPDFGVVRAGPPRR